MEQLDLDPLREGASPPPGFPSGADGAYACRSSDSGSDMNDDGAVYRRGSAASSSSSSSTPDDPPAVAVHQPPYTSPLKQPESQPEEALAPNDMALRTTPPSSPSNTASAGGGAPRRSEGKGKMLRITNVPTNMSVANIRAHFAQFGTIESLEYTYRKTAKGCVIVRCVSLHTPPAARRPPL